MAIALGAYGTIAVIWAVVWGIAAGVEHDHWQTAVDRPYAKEGEARDYRQKFLGAVLQLVMAPVWPASLVIFGYKFTKRAVQEVRRAAREEIAEVLDEKVKNDIAEAAKQFRAKHPKGQP